ncbi:MAG: hypothetical protein AABX53_03995 [Nanoarchaeota archaeon]
MAISIFLISPATSYEISATPAETVINIDPGEKACQAVEVETGSEELAISTRWSPTKSRNVHEFTYEATDLGITVSGPSKVNRIEGEFTICVKVLEAYAYYGIIIIEDPVANAGLGVWITLNPTLLEKKISKQQKQSAEKETTRTKQILTGNAINNSRESSINMYAYLLSLASLVCLLAILAVFLHRKHVRQPTFKTLHNPNPY